MQPFDGEESALHYLQRKRAISAHSMVHFEEWQDYTRRFQDVTELSDATLDFAQASVVRADEDLLGYKNALKSYATGGATGVRAEAVLVQEGPERHQLT